MERAENHNVVIQFHPQRLTCHTYTLRRYTNYLNLRMLVRTENHNRVMQSNSALPPRKATDIYYLCQSCLYAIELGLLLFL